MRLLFATIFLINSSNFVNSRNLCVQRDYGNGGIVCVCNETYCDTFDPITRTPSRIVTLYESSKSGSRFEQKSLHFDAYDNIRHDSFDGQNNSKRITIDRNVRHQRIIGFGGAFTDSAGINILSLGPLMSERIIREYFSPEGLSYSMARVPIGGSDFSTRPYTYNDVNDGEDLQLTHFNLTEEDLVYKIPLILSALNASSWGVKIFGSPWSGPAWMKANNNITGGRLKGEPGGEYHKAWAQYIVKFLDAYKSHGIDIWGITPQNQPMHGILFTCHFNCMGFTYEEQRDFIKLDLGPALESAGYHPDKFRIIIPDDIMMFIGLWAYTILSDVNAAKYVSGIGFHWYLNFLIPPQQLDLTHSQFPDYFLLSTEACVGPFFDEGHKVSLGDWSRGESYANDIITDLKHSTGGWVDWNLALNTEGGPNWVGNFVDAAIIINASGQEYYRQPMFYALAHFSKFLPPDSQRIETKDEGTENLQTVVFETPENATVLIAVNQHDYEIQLILNDPSAGYFSTFVPPHSIQSYVWFNDEQYTNTSPKRDHYGEKEF